MGHPMTETWNKAFKRGISECFLKSGLKHFNKFGVWEKLISTSGKKISQPICKKKPKKLAYNFWGKSI